MSKQNQLQGNESSQQQMDNKNSSKKGYTIGLLVIPIIIASGLILFFAAGINLSQPPASTVSYATETQSIGQQGSPR